MKLSDAQKQAVELAQKSSGVLYRQPGGYWYNGNSAVSTNTRTVKALINKGVFSVTRHAKNSIGGFPVEVKLSENHAKPS